MIDGVFFQLASSGIARVWKSLMPRLAQTTDLEVFVLDRGGAPDFPNVNKVPFPTYHDRYTADDSILIQRLCDFYAIDVFTTTYYTSPISTPMLLVVYDMIPELLDFDLRERFWMEKEVAIAFARRLLAISESTKNDLLRFYPEIPAERVTVAYPGYEPEIFYPRDGNENRRLRQQTGFERPYLLLVGSRDQHKGYKNAKLLFEAIEQIGDSEIDIMCAGGELEIDADVRRLIGDRCKVERFDFTDDELAKAYSGALALVYPSLYEGFGLPVLEAMACGCPVITTNRGSLAEVASEKSCLIINGTDVSELIEAINTISVGDKRGDLIAAGLQRAKAFSWDAMADVIAKQTNSLAKAGAAGNFDAFFADWRKLRLLQAEVDADTMR